MIRVSTNYDYVIGKIQDEVVKAYDELTGQVCVWKFSEIMAWFGVEFSGYVKMELADMWNNDPTSPLTFEQHDEAFKTMCTDTVNSMKQEELQMYQYAITFI